MGTESVFPPDMLAKFDQEWAQNDETAARLVKVYIDNPDMCTPIQVFVDAQCVTDIEIARAIIGQLVYRAARETIEKNLGYGLDAHSADG